MTAGKKDDLKYLFQWRIQKSRGAGDFFQKWAQKSLKCFYVEVMQTELQIVLWNEEYLISYFS